MSGSVVLGVLGAIEFTEPAVVRVRSDRKRRLLAALAVAGGRETSVDRLVDVVWSSLPPRTARHALQVYISEIRAQLGSAGAGLVTTTLGYRLDLDIVTTDLAVLAALEGHARDAAVAGRFDEAADMYQRALDLWRGEPFEGIDDDVVHAERARLDALQAGLRDELAAAYLALGRHGELIPQLQARIRDEPLRELAYEQLMVALYRSGRQSEALDVYRQARATLVDQVGVEPGPRLAAIEQAVLHHDATVLEPEVPSAVPSAPRQPFVGREREFTALTVAADDVAIGGQALVVLVGGEPGIGKTRLVDEWTSGLVGWTVRRGRCPEDVGAPALWAIAEALRSVDESAVTEAASGRPVLDPLLRLMGQERRGTGPSDDMRPTRFELHDAVADVLLALAVEPTVLVLDDAHWADESTMGAVLRVAQRSTTAPLLIVLTHRVAGVDRRAAFDEAHARLVREPVSRAIVVGPLDDADSADLLHRLDLDLSELDINRVCGRSEGNPFYLAELAHLVSASGGFSDHALPDSLRLVLAARLSQLVDGEVLASAAVIGRVFSTGILARLGDHSAAEISRALAAAVRSAIISQADSTTWEFTHMLFVDAAEQGLDDDRRRALHLRIAEILETVSRSDGVGAATDIARHRVAALPLGEPTVTAQACLRAGDEQLATFVYEGAAASYDAARRALEHVDGDGRAVARAIVGEAEALAAAGFSGRALELIDEALPLIDRDADPELFALAVRVLVLHRSTAAASGDARIAGLLADAIDHLGDRPGWLGIQLQCDLGLLYYRTEGSLRSEEIARDAVRRADAGDDALARLLATSALHQGMWRPSTLTERLDLADRAQTMARELGLVWHESMAAVFRAADSWEAGDLERVEVDLATALDLADRGRRPRFIWMARSWTALLDLYRGDRVDAEAGFAEALAVWGPDPNPDAVQCFFAQQLTIRLIDGDSSDLIDGLRDVAASDPSPAMWNALLSYPYVLADRHDAAHGVLDAVMAEGVDRIPNDLMHHVCLAMLAEAAHVLERRDVAAAVAAVLAPFPERRIVSNVYGGGGICWGSVAHQLGICAATLGDLGTARTWLELAIDHHRADRAQPFLERSAGCLVALGAG